MYACICAAVPANDVYRCIGAGACTVEEIGEQCQAGTGCGGCHDTLEIMIDEQLAAPDAA